MPNRLANETSLYLKQHANNPVDWYSWGPDALARAKDHPTLDLLVKLVQDPSFLNRSSEEMQAFLNAISEIGGPAMIAFFEEQAGRSSGLFKIRAGTEVRGTAKHLRDRLLQEGEK